MGLLTKEVYINLCSINIKWYEDKGYIIPKYIDNQNREKVKNGTQLKVNVYDLPNTTHVLVNVECDCCEEKIIGMTWENYKKYIKEDGKYYCVKCVRNGYKKWISFKEWCYKNLPKELADWILSRWDDDLNVDIHGNKLTPNDITYASNGFDNKGYWFKCLDHPEHGSEQKCISSFTTRFKGFIGRIECNQCNTISITHPYLIKYLVNEKDAVLYSHGSNKKIPMRCIEHGCGYKKEKSINSLLRQGFCCPNCEDGVSYPEKFTSSVLKQLNILFKMQLSKNMFDWCGNYRYDFYLDNFYMIIETHGLQHYEEVMSNWGKSLSEIQENDQNKEILAKNNNIKNYLVIDCRKSEMEWIKNSIMNRDLNYPDQPCLAELLNFKEDDIDWLKAHEWACNSLVRVASDLWSSGVKNVIEISNILNINKGTVVRYLKQGSKNNWCNYNPVEEVKHHRKVICLTTYDIFNSILEASNIYQVNKSSITQCCKQNVKTSGTLKTGEKLVWMYYDDYILQTEEQIKSTINNSNNNKQFKQIICLTTNEVFSSQREAERKYNINRGSIYSCCRNIYKSAGKHPITNEPLRWQYYSEYIKSNPLPTAI